MAESSKTQYKGVYIRRSLGKYKAHIHVKGKQMHLGYFDTAEKANEARKTAEVKYGLSKGPTLF